jgi:hypothetical protein
MLDRALTIVDGSGTEAVARVYRDTLAGTVSPREGHMLAL